MSTSPYENDRENEAVGDDLGYPCRWCGEYVCELDGNGDCTERVKREEQENG